MGLEILQKLYEELSIRAVVESPRDCKILYAQRFIRFAAYGSTTLVLVLFLKKLNINEEQIGLFMTLTLLGDVAISLVLTVIADGVGRRRMLAFGAFSMACSGIVFALLSNFWILLAAAVFGVISPSGNEIGPFRAIEESTLAHLIPKNDRTSILAWYHLCGFAGSSLGILVCGWSVRSLQMNLGWAPLESYRVVFFAYTALGLIKLFLSFCLSSACEPEKKAEDPPPSTKNAPDETRPLLAQDDGGSQKPAQLTSIQHIRFKSILPQLTPESLSLVWKLCLLFCIDSFASGLTPTPWMTYFFNQKFHFAEGKLGSIFFVTSILSSMSGLVAASLAKRIGLINTMVFTHIPASVALALIPVPNNAGIAVALLAFRSSTSSMDQIPRQAFLAAAVLPDERTTVMGIVNVVKTLSQSAGPLITGALAAASIFWVAFVTAGRLFSDSRSPQHTPFSQAPTLRNTPKEPAVNDHGLKLRLKRSINALRTTSRLSIARRPETHTVHHDAAVELAREQYFANVQEELIHRPPTISNPNAARRQKPFPKSVRTQQDKETETVDNCKRQTSETPRSDCKKRTFSTTLQNHLRRAFGVSTSPKAAVPLQHLEVPMHHVIDRHDGDAPYPSFDHFVVGEEEESRRQSFYVSSKAELASPEEADRFSPTLHHTVSGESLHSNTRSRVTSWTNSTVTASSLSTLQPGLERNRLSIIKEDGGPHQPSSSAGRHLGGIRIFQEPLEKEDENGDQLPVVDSQRLYSALMKRIGEDEVEMEQTKVALNEIHNGKTRSARGLRDPNHLTIRAVSDATVSTQPDAEDGLKNVSLEERHRIDDRLTKMALQEEQSSFFPFSGQERSITPSPFRRFLKEHHSNETSNESSTELSPGGNVDLSRMRCCSGRAIYSESIYSKTTDGGLNADYQRPQASVDELAATTEATSDDIDVATIPPLKQINAAEPRRRLLLTEIDEKGEGFGRIKDQMATLSTTNSKTKRHRRERAQIDPDDVQVGTLDIGKATGKALTESRFSPLVVKEVPKNTIPAPEWSWGVTKNRTGLLKRMSSIDACSVTGKSEEKGKVSAGSRKYSPGNIARILRERKSQVLTSRGEGRDKENSVGVGEESPPISTPGRLQLQLRNGNGRLRKRRSESTVSKDQTTPKSFHMPLHTKGGEYDESPTERVKQSLSARLSRPFDMDVPPGNRPFDSVYLGKRNAGTTSGARLSVAPNVGDADSRANGYGGLGRSPFQADTALPTLANPNNESGKAKGIWSSKRMVSDFLKRRRGARSSSQDTPTAGGDESESKEKEMTAAFL
ncbi:hypothetical protein DV736_g1534, partial [Chaetothyriales sp. CBS 134916]